MGVWGVGIFENDDALDLLTALVKSQNIYLVDKILQAALGAQYLEQKEASCALAAAEVVASIKNANYSYVPSSAVKWIRKQKITNIENKVHLALKAVQRVRTDSELRNLWIESRNEPEWFMAVDSLLDRLKG